jgi:hypothetical protein
LNQYLQAGVNHELHVPPTQVIRLDIWADFYCFRR